MFRITIVALVVIWTRGPIIEVDEAELKVGRLSKLKNKMHLKKTFTKSNLDA